MTDTGTTTETGTTTVPVLDDGDHDRFAHYVVQDDLVRSKATGEPVRALCGKIWTPDRDPKRYPVCPTCKEIAARWQTRGSN